MVQEEQNTSGLKHKAIMPDEIKGWNWGAFYLNWIWGIGNSTYLALLMFVPVINIILMFVLGAKGNQWAWENRYWRDVAHFKQTQRKWAFAGMIFWFALFGVGFILLGFLKGKPYELSLAEVQKNPEVILMLGSTIKPGYVVLGELDIPQKGKQGYAELYYTISGPKGRAHVAMRAYIKNGRWELYQLIVESTATGQRLILITPTFPKQKMKQVTAEHEYSEKQAKKYIF